MVSYMHLSFQTSIGTASFSMFTEPTIVSLGRSLIQKAAIGEALQSMMNLLRFYVSFNCHQQEESFCSHALQTGSAVVDLAEFSF